jgi:hypothetical protein
MNNHLSIGYGGRIFTRAFALVGGVGLLIASLTFPNNSVRAQDKDKDGLGFVISGKAGAEDVGLPIYPGSKPHKENSDDSPAVRMGLWGGGSGFKLAVVKMETVESPRKVAAFYKKALVRYGKVLDCTNPSSANSNEGQSSVEKEDPSNVLTCADDHPDPGGMLFKAGTKDRQHLVSIQPNGQGAFYQLVALGDWSKGNKN